MERIEKGKRWDEYIQKKQDELWEKLFAIEQERRHGKVIMKVLDGKRVIGSLVTLPAFGVLYRGLRGSWQYAFKIPEDMRDRRGKAIFWLYPKSKDFGKKIVWCEVEKIEEIQ